MHYSQVGHVTLESGPNGIFKMPGYLAFRVTKFSHDFFQKTPIFAVSIVCGCALCWYPGKRVVCCQQKITGTSRIKSRTSDMTSLTTAQRTDLIRCYHQAG